MRPTRGDSMRIRQKTILSATLAAWTIVGLAASSGQAASPDRPNIIVISSDDYAWPFYGFMQKWQRALRGEVGGPVLLGPAYKADLELASSNIDRYQLILPDDDDIVGTKPAPADGRGAAYTYRMQDILTPALDAIAYGGHFFPFAENAASKCQPGFASIMTGLHRADAEHVSPSVTSGLISPILPEWLPGFAWGANHIVQQIDPQNVATGDYYLTMAAGKYDWGLTHVHADSPNTDRRPFDRTLITSGEGNEGRKMVDWDPTSPRTRDNRPLAEIKNFIECTRCDKRCTLGPVDPYTGLRRDCDDDADCPSGFGTCEFDPSACAWPSQDFRAGQPADP